MEDYMRIRKSIARLAAPALLAALGWVGVCTLRANEEASKRGEEGFHAVFNGKDLKDWEFHGEGEGYYVEDGAITCKPGNGGNLFTKDEFSNFELRLEFKLTPGANNGIGLRAPLTGDAAYEGMECQVLDDQDDKWKGQLKEYQFHGSIYGVIPAKSGHLKPAGEWNEESIVLDGSKVKVVLNGEVIVEGDIAEAAKNGTVDGREHPGLARKSGHIGFLGHGDQVWFRNIRVKKID